MSDHTRCRWCGRPLTDAAIRHYDRMCSSCRDSVPIIEPENGRWWRELLSPDARSYVETNYPEGS